MSMCYRVEPCIDETHRWKADSLMCAPIILICWSYTANSRQLSCLRSVMCVFLAVGSSFVSKTIQNQLSEWSKIFRWIVKII